MKSSSQTPLTAPVAEDGCAIASQGLHVCLGQGSGKRHVLQGVDVRIATGRWTAVVGPNGAGKSTLLRALAGLLPHDKKQAGRHAAQRAQNSLISTDTAHTLDAGQVYWRGQPLSDMTPKQRAQHMAWLGQNESAAPDMRVWDVVMLGRLAHQGRLAIPSARDMQVVEQALRKMRAWQWCNRPLGQLSGGERQRVLLARVLATQAHLLLMDEPLANLDPPHQADWLATVRDLVSQGKTVVSVLHELNIALMSDDLLVLRPAPQGENDSEGERAHAAKQASKQVLYFGATQSRQARDALEKVFQNRIRIEALPAARGNEARQRWAAMPII